MPCNRLVRLHICPVAASFSVTQCMIFMPSQQRARWDVADMVTRSPKVSEGREAYGSSRGLPSGGWAVSPEAAAARTLQSQSDSQRRGVYRDHAPLKTASAGKPTRQPPPRKPGMAPRLPVLRNQPATVGNRSHERTESQPSRRRIQAVMQGKPAVARTRYPAMLQK